MSQWVTLITGFWEIVQAEIVFAGSEYLLGWLGGQCKRSGCEFVTRGVDFIPSVLFGTVEGHLT